MHSVTRPTRAPQRILGTTLALAPLVIAAMIVPPSASSATGTTGASSSVLMVVGDSTTPTPGEAAVADRLVATGLVATLADDEEVTPGEAEASDLVWISSTVHSAVVDDGLPDVTTPIILSKPWLFDDYGLTDSTSSNYGSIVTTEITITSPLDPTASGLTGSIRPARGSARVPIATPTDSATIVATAGGAATLFHVQADEPLSDGSPAPACRLSFPAFQNHPVSFTSEAWTLFDATARYALANCAAPTRDRRVMFGMTPGRDRDADLITAEETLGRRLDLVRVFERWDARPSPFHQQVAARGRTMVLSVRATNRDGSPVLWREIADARSGSALHTRMVSWANHVKSLDTEVIFSFNHEPETAANLAKGSAADYVAAWRRFRQVFADEGVDNARWAWIMTAYSFRLPDDDRRAAEKWFPGDGAVDVLGVDAYNWAGCHPSAGVRWRPFADVVERFRQFAELHPRQDLLIAEFASPERSTDVPGTDKGDWIRDAQSVFTQPEWDRLIGVSYFNDNTAQPTCSFPIYSSPASLDAIQAMADDVVFGGED